MGLCSRRKKVSESQDPDEVTVTCFGGKRKDKKSAGAFSGILVETEGLIKDLRQEVTELRRAQSGKHGEAKRLEESVTRLMEEKERLTEERVRLREELKDLRTGNNDLEQRSERLTSENRELAKEMKAQSQELQTSMETTREEHKQTTLTAESLKVECQDVKTTLRKTHGELEQTTSELRELSGRYETSQEEIERLTRVLSNLEMCKLMTENELQHKMAAIKRKYTDLKRLCRGKDVLIQRLKEEKSRVLMQLWQTTYGQTNKLPSCIYGAAPRSKQDMIDITAPKQLPLATVEPFHNDVITVSTATSPFKEQDTDQLSDQFLKNKTMSIEFELFRQRKVAEIFGTESLSVSDIGDNTCTGSDVIDDASDGVSDYVDSFLDCVRQKDYYETTSNLGSVSSEMIL